VIAFFVGPTLDAGVVQRSLPEAVVLPPAAQGDVFRACESGARVIAIVDGYFESVPAVWHKEILWAMSQGVHVYGAASMGALRAAELADFGMVGVGEIFERFRRGEYERDDEVAVIHGDAASGYRAMSVALVDIRATLDRAEREGVIDAELARRLLDDSKAAFYSERTWHRLALAAERECPLEQREQVSSWLFVNAVAQKKADARALLERLQRDRAEHQAPKRVDFHFEYTEFFRVACVRDGRWGEGAGLDRSEALLDELRLEGVERYAAAVQSARERALAVEQAQAQGFEASVEQIEAVWAELTSRHGLDDAEKRRAWCSERGLEGEEFVRFLREEAAVAYQRQQRAGTAPRAIADHLRLEGSYPELARRVREKLALAREVPSEEPAEAEVVRWYYEERLGGAIPEDLAEQARRLELPHREVWIEILRREYRKRARLAERGSARQGG
jgi:hypothetical protein